MGAVTGYGWGMDALVAGVASEKSAAHDAEVDGQRAWACVIPDPEDGPVPPDDRYERAVAASIDEAVADAEARGWVPGDTVGLIFSTGISDVLTLRDNFFSGGPRPRPSLFPHMLHTAIGSIVGTRYGWTGPNLVLNAACSSGNVALQTAELWLRSGLATDVIVAGGELCLVEQIVTGFRRMRVLLGPDRSARRLPAVPGGQPAASSWARRRWPPSSPARAGPTAGGPPTGAAAPPTTPSTWSPPSRRAPSSSGPSDLALAAAGATPDDVAVVKAHGSGTAAQRPGGGGARRPHVPRPHPPVQLQAAARPRHGGRRPHRDGRPASPATPTARLPVRPSDEAAHPRLADGEPVPDGLALCLSVGLGGANTAAVFAIDR